MTPPLADMTKRQLKTLYFFAERENHSRLMKRTTLPPVNCVKVTEAIPQADGTTLWRMQYTSKRLAAALNTDPRAVHAIRTRIEQSLPVYSLPPPRRVLRDPPPVERDYGPDDYMVEAAALRYG